MGSSTALWFSYSYSNCRNRPCRLLLFGIKRLYGRSSVLFHSIFSAVVFYVYVFCVLKWKASCYPHPTPSRVITFFGHEIIKNCTLFLLPNLSVSARNTKIQYEIMVIYGSYRFPWTFPYTTFFWVGMPFFFFFKKYVF